MKKTAIVTGASRGIGYGVALRLAQEGWSVAVTATRPEADYEQGLQKLRDTGADILYVQGDIGSDKDRQHALEAAVSRFGSVRLLVNNAGIAPRVRSDLLEMTEESFDEVVGTNTKGTMFMSQIVAKQMLTQSMVDGKRGTIINISSCSAVTASVNRGEYCVSKAGIAMLTKLYAARLAPHGIFVYEVRPGVIATDMTEGARDKYDALIQSGAFPIARWGTAGDVAAAVSAFAGNSFLYSTGSCIDVDGGFHIPQL